MNSTSNEMSFPPLKNHSVTAEFADESITSDGGILLLREIDKKLGLSKKLADLIPDERDPNRITHSIQSMLQQRIFGLALGYEDLNDHDTLRFDPAFQTGVERLDTLASSPTLCRLEKTANREMAFNMNKLLVENFIASFSTPPKKIILDFDATDNEIHGNQEGKYYHGYYQHHCFLPLYVYSGHHVLVSYLRPSNTDPAKHVWAILALLVKHLRSVWPDVKIIFRGDGAFSRDKIMSWCERYNVGYIIGMSKNSRLISMTKDLIVRAEKDYEESGQKQRLFDQIFYSAARWTRERKIIVKAEHQEKGPNVRFIVSNLPEILPQNLYDKFYCKRGDMENRIKEVKLDCKGARTSCHRWWGNQFRLMLSSFAYHLLDSVRRIALSETIFAKAQCETIRLKLLKIGAMVIRKRNQIRFILSAHYPNKLTFQQAKLAIVTS